MEARQSRLTDVNIVKECKKKLRRIMLNKGERTKRTEVSTRG